MTGAPCSPRRTWDEKEAAVAATTAAYQEGKQSKNLQALQVSSQMPANGKQRFTRLFHSRHHHRSFQARDHQRCDRGRVHLTAQLTCPLPGANDLRNAATPLIECS